MNALQSAVTIVPSSYPALEAEMYYSLDYIDERETELPPPSAEYPSTLEAE